MIASTFPSAEELSPEMDYSPFTTDTETEYEQTPAMPLLPDMPTRSRILLENLGSKPILPQPAASPRQQRQHVHRTGAETTLYTALF